MNYKMGQENILLQEKENQIRIHAKKIIDKLTSRPEVFDEDEFYDRLADEKQMIDIVANYLKHIWK